jgi:hypothetical protein
MNKDPHRSIFSALVAVHGDGINPQQRSNGVEYIPRLHGRISRDPIASLHFTWTPSVGIVLHLIS